MKVTMRNIVLIVCLLPMLGHAMTAAQEELQNAPMPHAGLSGSGHMVKVHFAHLEGHSTKLVDDNVRKLRETLEISCPLKGLPVPGEFPEFGVFMREDNYYSPNRTIKYFRAQRYFVSLTTCQITDVPLSYTATLESNNGVCIIDLIKKKAIGDCDPVQHAAAVPAPRGRVDKNTFKALAQSQQGTPMGHALESVIDTAPTPKGKKTILGMECEMWTVSLLRMIDCLATGGSFQPTLSHNGGMALESLSEMGDDGIVPTMHAVEAKLDTQVSDAVFSPHVGTGFTIHETGNHRALEALKNSTKKAK